MWRAARVFMSFPSVSRSFASRAQIEAAILEAFRESETVDHAKLSLTATFKEVKLDSLEQVDVLSKIEDKLGLMITDNEALHLKSIPEAVSAFLAAAEKK
mmetsp:Transcript_10975/g.21494  ORF Transcript_10975/g.21494 Transcript_10975/m.21494 type:complete len:100 (+) Transcript_10975:1000-1299(+)